MFNKIKNGFTLAEVLITLVIIGVVAAMTIPTAINNHHKKQVGIKLKKFYSVMSQALMRYYADEGINPDSFEVAEDVVRDGQKSLEWFNNSLGKYITTVNKKKNDIFYQVAFNDGSGFSSYVFAKKEMYFFYCTEYNRCSNEHYDGRTGFLFKIRNGIFSTYNESTNRNSVLNFCKNPSSYLPSASKTQRHACSRLIMLDGWEVKDDYPWYPDI